MQATNVSSDQALVDITQVVPRSDADQPLFTELYEVLKRHNALRRFGVSLLHQHFEISPDEVLLETTDKTDRTQLIQPIPKAELAGLDYIETSWRLDGGPKPLMACICITFREHTHLPRPSDVVLKANIQPLEGGLDRVLQMQPKTYHYVSGVVPALRLPDGLQNGFIAQELEGLFPELVSTRNAGTSTEYKAVDYTGLIPVLVAAVQDQQREISELRRRLDGDPNGR
jgi:Chaperone of endosialidase